MNRKIKEIQPAWETIIETAFFKAWEDSSPVDLTDYAYLIRREFDLAATGNRLDLELTGSKTMATDVNAHIENFNLMAAIFVQALLLVSDDGKMITHHNIQKARAILARERVFQTYAC